MKGVPTIKISDQKPEIYTRLQEKFGVDWDKGVIVSFFPLVHCKFQLSPAKIVHESVHIRNQEKDGVENWWDRYFEDPQFRLEEEILAYATEADFVKTTVKNRELRHKMIWDMAKDLSSEMYGNLITHSEALKLIQ